MFVLVALFKPVLLSQPNFKSALLIRSITALTVFYNHDLQPLQMLSSSYT